LTEYKRTETKNRISWLGPVIALVLIAEAILAVTLGNRQTRQEEAELQAAQAAADATAPPAPSSLGQILGVSADDWNLALVRSDMPLPADFVPEFFHCDHKNTPLIRIQTICILPYFQFRGKGSPCMPGEFVIGYEKR